MSVVAGVITAVATIGVAAAEFAEDCWAVTVADGSAPRVTRQVVTKKLRRLSMIILLAIGLIRVVGNEFNSEPNLSQRWCTTQAHIPDAREAGESIKPGVERSGTPGSVHR